MNRLKFATAALLLSCVSVAAAQAPAPGGGMSPEDREKQQKQMAAYRLMPDMPGTGAYPAYKLEDPSLPAHTIYRPKDLSKLGGAKLPIVAWGNGSCAANGAGQRLHLLELASHGYLVVANGGIAPERPPAPSAAAGAPPAPPAPPAAGAPPAAPRPPATRAEQMTETIDWAIAENKRAGSEYFGKIDVDKIATSGWSCGGVQALTIATRDPRVKAVVINNSGLRPADPAQPAQANANMSLPKSALDKLTVPTIYVLGGVKDIAQKNGLDDFAYIKNAQVAVADLVAGDHGGSFWEPNGGVAAQVSAAWLDWRLKGDANAAKYFVGADCKLCADPKWKYQRKGF